MKKNINILIIATGMPKYDLNSGDLRFYTIIKILAENFNIYYFCTSDRDKGSRYAEKLKQLGIEIHFGSSSFSDILRSNKYILAFFEFYYTINYYVDRLRILQPECRIVVDTVDIHYMRLLMKYSLTKNENDLRIMEETRLKEISAYEKADLLITVTEDDAVALKDEMKYFNYYVIPNVHDIVISDMPVQKNTLIFVGGFNHEPNVDAMVYFCKQVFPLIREKYNVNLVIVGSNPPEQVQTLNNTHITVTGFVESTTPYLHSSYISIAPLRFGAGMKGKIGEAMAHGLPVVTTSVGAQGMGLEHGVNILIADSERDFADSVLQLLFNDELYEKISKNSLQFVQENYTTELVEIKLKYMVDTIMDIPAMKMTVKDKIMFLYLYLLQRIRPNKQG